MPPVHRQGRDAGPRDQRKRKKAFPQDVAQRLEARDGLPDPIEPTVRANQVERERTRLGHGAKLENGTERTHVQRTSTPLANGAASCARIVKSMTRAQRTSTYIEG